MVFTDNNGNLVIVCNAPASELGYFLESIHEVIKDAVTADTFDGGTTGNGIANLLRLASWMLPGEGQIKLPTYPATARKARANHVNGDGTDGGEDSCLD